MLGGQVVAMEDVWIEAGFFLVSGGSSPERQRHLLPARMATVSTCIVESYPDQWALPGVKTKPDELRQIRESLSLDESGLEELRCWVERALDEGNIGWPNVFFSLRAARELRSRFLGALQDSRLLGLSIAKDLAAEFIREQRDGAPSVSTMVARGIPLAQCSPPLGFDVLGAEYGGSFHTFSCNGLERAFAEKLGIKLNSYGLIDEYSAAVAACEYANRDDVGAEPVAWYPFRVDDYPLESRASSRWSP